MRTLSSIILLVAAFELSVCKLIGANVDEDHGIVFDLSAKIDTLLTTVKKMEDQMKIKTNPDLRQYVPFSKREIPASRNSSDTEPSFPRGPRTSPTAAGNFRRNFTTIGRWKKCVGRLPVSAVKANKSVKNIKEKANSKMMFGKIVYRKLCVDLL